MKVKACLSVCLWSAVFLSGERGSPVHSMGRVTLDRKQRGQPPCVTACVRCQEGVFHWRKSLRFSVVCHRQGKRFSWYGGSVRPESQTIAPRSHCTLREGGAEAVFYSDYLHCDLRLSTQRYFVPNGDRILELVVSTEAEWRVRCRGYWSI